MLENIPTRDEKDGGIRKLVLLKYTDNYVDGVRMLRGSIKGKLIFRFRKREQKFLGHIISKERLANRTFIGHIKGKGGDKGSPI